MAKPNAKEEPAGMGKMELKRHLKFARNEPIPIAFALGADGKAIVEMDKRKPGRALEKKLKDTAPDSKNHRWGMASVDPENEKTIVFTINKAGGGMARKLTLALKGTGFNKVKIQLEDGTEVEAHEDEAPEEEVDEDEAPNGPQTIDAEPDASDSEDEPRPQAAQDGDVEQPPLAAGEPQAGPAAADAASLAKDLTGLVKRMLVVVAKDPTQKAALTEMATDAQVSIKRGDLAQASAGIDIFREAIGDVESAQASGGAAAGANAPPRPNGAAAPAANGAKPPAAGNGADLAGEAKEIMAALADAIKKVMPAIQGIPGLGDVVKATAAQVQGHVKAGRHEEARKGIAEIHKSAQGLPPAQQGAELGGAAGAMAGAAAAGAANGQAANGVGAEAGAAVKSAHQIRTEKHAPGIDLSRKVWEATRAKVFSEIDALHGEIEKALKGHGMGDELTKTMRKKVDEAMHALGDGLSHSLTSINKAADPDEREKHVQAAHDHVNQIHDHVSSHKVFEMIDRNPFKKLGITKLVTASLQAIHQTIR